VLFCSLASDCSSFIGSCHIELAGLVAGQPRPNSLPVFSKKGTLQVELTALNFSVMGAAPGDPQITANKAIAAESARKRAAFKKHKSTEKGVAKVLGKDAGKFAKGLAKLF
jgi:hypothetical protein